MPTKPSDTKKSIEEPPKSKPAKLIIVFLLCFILSVGTSSGVAYFLLTPSVENPEIDKQFADQKASLSNVELSLSKQNIKIAAIEDQSNELKLYLRHSSATALKNILIDQEKNIQSYLKVMKSAMSDLSDTIPRTSDWNNEYQYQLDLALKKSIEREDLLKLLKTGEPNDTPQ